MRIGLNSVRICQLRRPSLGTWVLDHANHCVVSEESKT